MWTTYRNATGLKGNESLLLQRVDGTANGRRIRARSCKVCRLPIDRTSEIDAGGVELKEYVNEAFSHAKDAVPPLVSLKWLTETMVAWRAKSSFFVTIWMAHLFHPFLQETFLGCVIEQSTDRLLYAIRIVEQDRGTSTSPLLGHHLSASSKKRYIPVSFLILTYQAPSESFVLRFIPSISPFPARSTSSDGEMDQSWVLFSEARLLLK